MSGGDVIAAVDEQSQLTVLSKTAVIQQEMDLITGKYNTVESQDGERTQSEGGAGAGATGGARGGE